MRIGIFSGSKNVVPDNEVANVISSKILNSELKQPTDHYEYVSKFIADTCLKPANGIDNIIDISIGNYSSLKKWVLFNTLIKWSSLSGVIGILYLLYTMIYFRSSVLSVITNITAGNINVIFAASIAYAAFFVLVCILLISLIGTFAFDCQKTIRVYRNMVCFFESNGPLYKDAETFAATVNRYVDRWSQNILANAYSMDDAINQRDIGYNFIRALFSINDIHSVSTTRLLLGDIVFSLILVTRENNDIKPAIYNDVVMKRFENSVETIMNDRQERPRYMKSPAPGIQ